MLKLLLLAILLTLIVIGFGKFKQMRPELKTKALWRLGTLLLLSLLVLLVITGRMHWVGALLGATLPFLRGIANFAIQFMPLWLKHRQSFATKPEDAMTAGEALHILGLNEQLDVESLLPLSAANEESTPKTRGECLQESLAMVQEAHRHLIQKLHPDRGGSNYLASKINLARDFLVNRITRYKP
jgi:hypothetical protein